MVAGAAVGAAVVEPTASPFCAVTCPWMSSKIIRGEQFGSGGRLISVAGHTIDLNCDAPDLCSGDEVRHMFSKYGPVRDVYLPSKSGILHDNRSASVPPFSPRFCAAAAPKCRPCCCSAFTACRGLL